MLVVASYPRSGNTFFRNVLYEVYGLSSSTYFLDESLNDYEELQTHPVIKTHVLPGQVPIKLLSNKIVYLIRDGRDALVSMAHHRKDIIAPGSDYQVNLIEAILAQEGSFFGGWSRNVKQWSSKAHLIIHFEDLISDPIGEIEKLRGIIDLPQPRFDKLPSFLDLKNGNPKYGGFESGKPIAALNFRRGIVGSWMDEMPKAYEALFWSQHGDVMQQVGYQRDRADVVTKQRKVVIEISKALTNDNDGVKRYVEELIHHLPAIIKHRPNWTIDLWFNQRIIPLNKNRKINTEKSIGQQLKDVADELSTFEYERRLLALKAKIRKSLPTSLYRLCSWLYRIGPYRFFLKQFRRMSEVFKDPMATKWLDTLNKYDLVHIPLPQHLRSSSSVKTPYVVTVHDLTHKLYPQFHLKENIRKAEKGMRKLVKLNADVISISQSTTNDLIDYYGYHQDKLHLVHEAVNQSAFTSEKKSNWGLVRKKYQIPKGEYLMCLSTIEPRKNLQNTIDAFLQMVSENPDVSTNLVICGKVGWNSADLLDRYKDANVRIIFTGFVDEKDLPILYARAIALCYVSHYEGFGLPLLEAMSCKTPVIFGNNSSMPEVVGEGGLPADSKNVDSIKLQMLRLVRDTELRTALAHRAWLRANQFSWLKVAIETLDVYERVIQREETKIVDIPQAEMLNAELVVS